MRVLIVKTSALGDIVQTFPVVAYLKENFPQMTIDWVVEKQGAPLVEAHPQIEQVHLIDSKKWRKNIFSRQTRREIKTFKKKLKSQIYDWVFDLQGNLKSTWVLKSVKSEHKVGFGWKSVPEWPNTLFTHQRFNPPQGNNIREDYLSLVQQALGKQATLRMNLQLALNEEEEQLLEQLNPTQAILVAAGSRWVNKSLPIEKLQALLQNIDQKQSSRFLFAWGSESEHQIASQLAKSVTSGEVLPKLSLPLLQRVMGECSLVISMDSLPLHLCATTKTPSVSFFGPSSAKKYAPSGSSHLSFQGSCPYSVKFEKRCPHLRSCKSGSCIREFDMEEVCSQINDSSR